MTRSRSWLLRSLSRLRIARDASANDEQDHAPEAERDPGGPRHPTRAWHQLLDRHVACDEEHPGDAHYADREQDAHEREAAPQAVEAVPHTFTNRSRLSSAARQ